MEELIKIYRKKLRIAQNLLEEMTKPEDKEARIRIVAKVSSYNNFIFELEKFLEINSNQKNGLNLKIALSEDRTVCQHGLNEQCTSQNPVNCISCGKLLVYEN